MLNIGCHLSSSKGFLHMGKEALSIGANTFQFFTRNPRGTKAKAINTEDAKNLVRFMLEHSFAPLLAHAPYTLNPCAADPHLRQLATDIIIDDLSRLEHLPGNMYNFHPGSHVSQGTERGIEFICQMLNTALTQNQQTTVLLETMSGKGSEVGRNFQELRSIIDGVQLQEKLGICLDTCHVWDAGYDIADNLQKVLEEFDNTIGLQRLKAIHLNGSLNPLGSKKDRHARIGEGCISLEAITRIINHPSLRDLPFYLETPNKLPGYESEIALLKTCYHK